MILVIGGAYQGKAEYVKEQLLAELSEQFPDTEYVVENAWHLKVKEQMKAGIDPMDAARKLLEMTEGNPKSEGGQESEKSREDAACGPSRKGKRLVVICDEVGYGVVPVDAFERAFREKTGRVCCYFAKEAQQVIRVVCGVGKRIK